MILDNNLRCVRLRNLSSSNYDSTDMEETISESAGDGELAVCEVQASIRQQSQPAVDAKEKIHCTDGFVTLVKVDNSNFKHDYKVNLTNDLNGPDSTWFSNRIARSLSGSTSQSEDLKNTPAITQSKSDIFNYAPGLNNGIINPTESIIYKSIAATAKNTNASNNNFNVVACDTHTDNSPYFENTTTRDNINFNTSTASPLKSNKCRRNKKKSTVLFAEKVADEIPESKFIPRSEESLVYLETNIDSFDVSNIKPTDIDVLASSSRGLVEDGHFLMPQKSEKYVLYNDRYTDSSGDDEISEKDPLKASRKCRKTLRASSSNKEPYLQELGHI